VAEASDKAPTRESAEEPMAPTESAEAPPRPPRSGPLGLVDRHPLMLAWLVLAIGMVAILLYTSRDVGLARSQLLAMVVATVAVAGACVWIISWE
jgi:hypothetical protein